MITKAREGERGLGEAHYGLTLQDVSLAHAYIVVKMKKGGGEKERERKEVQIDPVPIATLGLTPSLFHSK